MELKGKKIGFCLTGSFYTFKNTFDEMKKIIKKGGEVIPIMSYYAYNTDSKFGKAKDFVSEIENITGKKVIHSMQEAEYISNYYELDIMIIAPCSRKYNCKTCKFDNRYTSISWSKKSFKR